MMDTSGSDKSGKTARHRFFDFLAMMADRYPWWVLIAAVVLTMVATGLAGRLELQMQFKNLMPQDHPTVREFDDIIEHFSTASNIIVAATGEETELKAFADDLAPKLRSMPEFIRRVDYKLERAFFEEHGFMLVEQRDLRNSENQYEDLGLLPFLTGLNDAFETTYVADGESISNKEKEDEAVRALDGIQFLLRSMHGVIEGTAAVDSTGIQAIDRLLFGDPYFISQDKDMLVLFAQPTFSVNELDKTIEAVNTVDSLIASVQSKYPSVDGGTTGMMALARDETVAATEDMYWTSIIAFILIIILFVFSFRMWAAPLLAGISLIVGVSWASGFVAATIGSLNIMTSMFAVILIGLGIDFNIHIISTYTEFRARGEPIGEAMRLALEKSGNGIVVGALTTAAAFLTMTVSENAGMKEFGFVSGSGLLFCLLAALFVLPSLLAVRDRLMMRFRGEHYKVRSTSFAALGRLGTAISRYRYPAIGMTLVVTALLLWSGLQIRFDYNYLNMEPKGLKSVALQDSMIAEFDVTPDMVLVTTLTVDESRDIAEEARALRSVGLVTSISDYVPSDEEQAQRRPYLERYRSDLQSGTATILRIGDLEPFIRQLYRLEDNIIELGQLAYVGGQDRVDQKTQQIVGDMSADPEDRQSLVAMVVDALERTPEVAVNRLQAFQQVYEPYLRRTAIGMTNTAPIVVDALPASILGQFAGHDGSRYLVSIYPKEQVWDMVFLGRFTEQMFRLDPRTTGLPPIFYVLIDYISRDGKIAATLTLIVVFFLLWFDFRRLRFALLAMIPLIGGAIWMVGLMHLFGMKLNVVNVIGIPLILGIGIDDGVHIMHRFKTEGAKNLDVVFSSTGKAVVLTSLTTMLAFGSLGFAVYRGLASLGITLLIGVGTALLTSLLVLPALLPKAPAEDPPDAPSESTNDE